MTVADTKENKQRSIMIQLLYVIGILGIIVYGLFVYLHAASKEQLNRITKHPHIILFLLDDAGANDFGYTSTDIKHATPYIDSLAAKGVKLTRFYTEHSCTVRFC